MPEADGVPAAEANLNGPSCIALDNEGNLLIGNYNTANIRKVAVEPPHIISTIVGKNTYYSGLDRSADGINALDAVLWPVDMAFDNDGNLLILAGYNYSSDWRIRKVTLASPIPDCPQSVTTTPQVSGQNVSNLITWQPPANKSTVKGYKIYRSDLGAIADIAENGSPSYTYTDPDLTDCTEYCYTVDAYNSQTKESTGCPSVCTTTPDVTPPAVPAVTASATSGHEVQLSWGESTDRCEGKAKGYNIYNAPGTKIGTTAATSFTVSGLEDCTGYCFTVSAYDSAGNES